MLDAFLQNRRQRGANEKTVEWYRLYVAAWLESRDANALRASLAGFLAKYRPQTQRSVFGAVRAYERFLAELEGKPAWIDSFYRKFEPAPRYPVLTQEEFDSMLKFLGAPVHDWRDRVMLSLLWYTGARLDAIRLLTPGDVDLEGSRLFVRTKGSVRATICIPDVVKGLLAGWCHTPRGAWLFPSCRVKNAPICKSHLQHQIKRLALLAGIKKRVWIHGLRHSAISMWINGGMRVETAQKQALHTSVSTTMKYLQMNDNAVKKEMDSVYSLRRKARMAFFAPFFFPLVGCLG